MFLKRSTVSVFAVLGALSAGVGCGSDDTGDDDKVVPGKPDAGEGMISECVSAPCKVVLSTDITRPLSPRKVQLWNLMTGEILTSIPAQTSAADGTVTFPSRPANTGTFVEGVEGFVDTWSVPRAASFEQNLIRQGTGGVETTVPMLGGFTHTPDAAAYSGAVYWTDSKGVDQWVGCAVVKGPGVNDARYFSGSLPTAITTRDKTQKDKGNNGPEAGKYYIGNLKPGLQTITAEVNGKVVGSTTFFVKSRSSSTPIAPAAGVAPVTSNLYLASIYVDKTITENPTPADCQ